MLRYNLWILWIMLITLDFYIKTPPHGYFEMAFR